MDADSSLLDLSRPDRMLLMQFVCSFVWADLEVKDEERALVARLVERLGFDEDERREIQQWLKVPPVPEAVDPARVPRKHRMLFYRAAETTIAVDGEVSPEEQDSLELFAQLIA